MRYRIRELRTAKGMTSYDLAKKSGVSRTTISKLETHGDEITTTKTLISLADALGVEVGELFSQDNV